MTEGEVMNTKSITESSNPVLAGSLPALKRAAAKAKAVAAQTGTRLVTKAHTQTPERQAGSRPKQ